MFSVDQTFVVLTPPWQEIREKYKGDSLEAFHKVLLPHRHESPSKQIQIWGRDPARTCLLFEHKPAPDRCIDGKLVVKEIFFIPYYPRTEKRGLK